MPKRVRKTAKKKNKDNPMQILLATMKTQIPAQRTMLKDLKNELLAKLKNSFNLGLIKIPDHILNMKISKFVEQGGNITQIMDQKMTGNIPTPMITEDIKPIIIPSKTNATPVVNNVPKTRGRTPAVVKANTQKRQKKASSTIGSIALPNNKLLAIDENTDSMPLLNAESFESVMQFKKRLSMMLKASDVPATCREQQAEQQQ